MPKGTRKAGRENWREDDTATHCSKCVAEFGLLTRRHHCRACGNIFCWRCCGKEISYTPFTRRGEQGYKEKVKRVCNACFRDITRARRKEVHLQRADLQRRAAAVKKEVLVDPRGDTGALIQGASLQGSAAAVRQEVDADRRGGPGSLIQGASLQRSAAVVRKEVDADRRGDAGMATPGAVNNDAAARDPCHVAVSGDKGEVEVSLIAAMLRMLYT